MVTENLDEAPSTKVYYLYSPSDNSYFYTTQKKVDSSTINTKKMTYVFSSKAFIMFSNPKKSFWLFNEGKAQSGFTNLGYKACRTEDGNIGIYKVFQNKVSYTKFYIPKEVFENGDINQEYPVYVK